MKYESEIFAKFTGRLVLIQRSHYAICSPNASHKDDLLDLVGCHVNDNVSLLKSMLVEIAGNPSGLIFEIFEVPAFTGKSILLHILIFVDFKLENAI